MKKKVAINRHSLSQHCHLRCSCLWNFLLFTSHLAYITYSSSRCLRSHIMKNLHPHNKPSVVAHAGGRERKASVSLVSIRLNNTVLKINTWGKTPLASSHVYMVSTPALTNAPRHEHAHPCIPHTNNRKKNVKE